MPAAWSSSKSAAYEQPQYDTAERLRQARRVVRGPRHKGSIGPEAAVGDEEVQVRMPVRTPAMRLQAGDNAHGELALAGQRANGGGHRAGSDAGDLTEAAAAIETVRAQPLGNREHHLPVRHQRQQRGVQPLRPDREALGVAARAEVPTLAREREQVLVFTVVAADARKPMFENAAREELVGDLRDDGAPRAVLAREPLVLDRL